MKLRVRDNSIRIRLTRGEVEQLRSTGVVEAMTSFPGGRRFSYVVESSPAYVEAAAFFSDGVIAVRVPEATVLAWAATNQVSIAAEQALDDGGSLAILVEKDFACLAPREGEDESDMFPHPDAGKEAC